MSKLTYGIIIISITFIYVVGFIHIGIDLPVFNWPDSGEYLHFRNCMNDGSCNWTNIFDGRPFTLPFLYYLVGPSFLIYLLQLIFFIISFIVLGYHVSTYFKPKWQRIIVFTFILLVSCNKSLFFWHHSLLSECATIIFFNFLVVILIVVNKRVQRARFKGLLIYVYTSVLLLLLFSHLRDSHAYITFFYLIILFFLFYKKVKTAYIHFILILSIITGNYFFQQHLIAKTNRYKAPLLNVISLRMLPHEEYSNWFFKNGLPKDSCTVSCKNIASFEYYNKWNCFGKYQTSEGLELYKKFLLNHPKYLLKELITHRNHILRKDQSFYAKQEKIHYFPTIALKITWHSIWTIIGSFVLLFIALIRKQIRYIRHETFIFIVSLCSMLVLAIVSYHGDAYEVGRHCFLVQYYTYLFSVFFFFILIKLINMNSRKNI